MDSNDARKLSADSKSIAGQLALSTDGLQNNEFPSEGTPSRKVYNRSPAQQEKSTKGEGTVGKSIRIFLADGVATGIRHGEIVNWSGQGIACPRVRLLELKAWPETRRPGVYFLLGTDKDGREAAYVGEAEDVFDRLKTHIQEKEFWNEVIIFTSKDDNLTKAHVRYLESQLHNLASQAGRYTLENFVTPQEASLPRGDRDAMREFVEDVRVLLGVFGHRLLEPLAPAPLALAKSDHEPAASTGVVTPPDTSSSPVFFLRVSNVVARAMRSDEGIVVLAGSDASRENLDSLSGGYKAHKERMLAEGVLEDSGTKLRFARDYPFSSPSQAAAIIVGYSINGRDAWRTATGQTYKQLEEAQAFQLPGPSTSD